MEYRLLITYDISDDLLRTKVHKFLRNYGINSQKSVFEMFLGKSEYRKVLIFLQKNIAEDNDTVRIYELCRSCLRKSQIIGEGTQLNTLDCQVIG